MSKRPLTIAKANDAVLGTFARVPRSEELDHAVRYLSTWSGSDKLFMIVQYAAKLLVPILEFRARVQHRAGLGAGQPNAKALAALQALSSSIGDARMLWRIWGILPIFQWMIALEKSHPPTRALLTIERLQGWSMVAYYPLEHIYFLASHRMLPWKISSRTLNKISLWSCRFWAVYVLLQFAHLREDLKLIKMGERALRAQEKGKSLAIKEDDGATPSALELAKRKRAVWNETVVNLGYLPLTLHWSLEGGLLANESLVAFFGLVAGLASFRGGWEATRRV
ncbi:hypothetical protein EXIGLDRAFT_736469 [Exidia glandulosa HHB12029]|uniref:Peroxisomal biogenesis factor 11 n=1 Tax=Exidia glandulosa HHB12029 TaxID=1314781 RepID=A0A165JEF9_EXIGL|nr:hypothetical protein EXIGLDRAFT_736469 [Exidia glandulosa HHB12029]